MIDPTSLLEILELQIKLIKSVVSFNLFLSSIVLNIDSLDNILINSLNL
mgnify:CR=1 FL=1